MNGSEEKLWKFSAQMMVVMLISLVTWDMMDALGQKRQLEKTPLGKTVERSTQTEFNTINQITVPTNVHCSPRGECYHTSKKCERLKKNAHGCRIAYSETDNEVENLVMDALETIKSLHLARSSILHESMRSSAVVAQAAAHRLIAHKPLR